MKRLMMALTGVIVGLALSLTMSPAEAAKRLGSGQSSGAQRDGVTQRQAVPPQASPAAPAAQQKSGMSRWLGPLAGLAAGLGLAWLLGDQLGSMMMGLLLIAALVVGAIFVMRMLNRNRQQPAMQGAGAGTSQYSGLGGGQFGGTQQPAQGGAAGYAPAAPGAPAAPAALAPAIPAGFNVAGFVEQAKRVFADLQAANDRGDLEALKEMSTDEMFETFRKDIVARAGAAQKVEIVWLQADLLEVVSEGGFQWASVRYTGSLRDAPGATPEDFTEVWNLQKPSDGSGGWVLAGIQQV